MNIEVEVRGKIKGLEKTLKLFHEKAKFIKTKDRLSFIYFRSDTTDVNEVRDDPIDLKLRITDKKPEIVMKYGRWGTTEARKEFLFPIELGKFEQALEFFKILNWHKGVLMDTKTFVFIYKNIEFALVQSGEFLYFEAEKLIADEKNVEASLDEIKSGCREMGLEIFEEKEFIDMMNAMNQRNDHLFDMNKQTFEEIKSKFRDYF